jgi:hypothetical protein
LFNIPHLFLLFTGSTTTGAAFFAAFTGVFDRLFMGAAFLAAGSALGDAGLDLGDGARELARDFGELAPDLGEETRLAAKTFFLGAGRDFGVDITF